MQSSTSTHKNTHRINTNDVRVTVLNRSLRKMLKHNPQNIKTKAIDAKPRGASLPVRWITLIQRFFAFPVMFLATFLCGATGSHSSFTFDDAPLLGYLPGVTPTEVPTVTCQHLDWCSHGYLLNTFWGSLLATTGQHFDWGSSAEVRTATLSAPHLVWGHLD